MLFRSLEKIKCIFFIGAADLCKANVSQSNGCGYNPWDDRKCHIQPHNLFLFFIFFNDFLSSSRTWELKYNENKVGESKWENLKL